jgi:hypothetical protein
MQVYGVYMETRKYCRMLLPNDESCTVNLLPVDQL